MGTKVFRVKPLDAALPAKAAKRPARSVSRTTMRVPEMNGAAISANGPSTNAGEISTNARGPAPEGHADGDALEAIEEMIPVARIDPSPWQKRRDFSGLEELAESLKGLGLRQAIVVRENGARYQLLAGERRLRAARLADWTQIRASVQACDDATARQVVLIENLQRKDLNPIEEAEQWRDLLAGPAAPTQTELAKKLGVTQGHISNRLRLLKLPKPFQECVISGEMAPSVARGLVQGRGRSVRRRVSTLTRRFPMLVLSRKSNQEIQIGGDVTITVLRVRGDEVRLGITAPRAVPVLRGEVLRRQDGQEIDHAG